MPMRPAPSRATLRHVPALDGLRGLALLGVLLFHANGALPGGYLGVDLFFVLSGFLITSLLLSEHARTGRVALAAFWARRARRLLPALVCLLPAIALYARVVAKPDELAGLRGDALATLGYVANWRAIFTHRSYWELFVAPSPLEHTWSLAIEEQFYVIWPLIVVLVLRRHTKRAVLLLSLGLAALSMALMVALFRAADTSRVYLGTDTRAVGLLVGVALATIFPLDATPPPRTGRLLDVLGLASAVGLGVAWCRLRGDSALLYHGGLWLTEVAALVLIVCAVRAPRSLVARALSIRPLTLLGSVSYGAYLWHWPANVVLTAERTHLRGLSLQGLHFAVTFAIAAFSYRFIERPILKHGLPFGRPVFVVPAALAGCVLLVVGATAARDATPLVAPPGGVATVAAQAVETPEVRVMMVGDSTANSLGWALRGLQRQGLAVELLGQDGCTLLADTCGGAEWAAKTEEVRPDATLVFVGGAFMHGIDFDGEWRKSCHPEWDRRFEATLARRLGDLRSARGQVWAVTVPYPLGPWDNGAIRTEVDCINASIRKVAAAAPGVGTLELADRLCPRGTCALESNGVTIRPDGAHYSIDGARDLAQWVLGQIEPPGGADGVATVGGWAQAVPLR